MTKPFLIVDNGSKTKTILKTVVTPDGETPRPSIVSEKAVADFTRVCDDTGILDQTKRLQESMDAGDIDAMAKVLREP